MIIGVLTLEVFFPFSHSLKDKRQILNRFKDRIRNRFNVSLAELEFQDKWQRARLGIVTLNSQQRVVEEILDRVLAEAEELFERQILSHRIEFL
jgi:uncharacterized protein YlxP (DUF503 family)